MKRMKLLFVAASIFGIGSAFTTLKTQQTEYLRLGQDNFVEKQAYIDANGGSCVEANPNDVCTWVPKDEQNPGSTDADFTAADSDGLGFIYQP